METNKCKHGRTTEEECLDCHWNAAIEEAAKIISDNKNYDRVGCVLATEIRKLKK